MTVKFEGHEWRLFILTLDKNIKDPQRLLKVAFTTRGFRDVIQHFEREIGEEGKWPRSERARLQRGKTLQDTGNLREDFMPTNLEEKGSNEVVFFNPTPYGRVHDIGDPGRGIPQRSFMWLTDRAQEDMTKIILDLVVK